MAGDNRKVDSGVLRDLAGATREKRDRLDSLYRECRSRVDAAPRRWNTGEWDGTLTFMRLELEQMDREQQELVDRAWKVDIAAAIAALPGLLPLSAWRFLLEAVAPFGLVLGATAGAADKLVSEFGRHGIQSAKSPDNPMLPSGSTSVYSPVPDWLGPLFKTGKGDDNGADISDISQGQLGDCYFLASLAAIVKSHPDYIRNMIKENGDGTYTVTFYRNGKPVEITVTGDLPCELWLIPAYARAGDGGEVWVCIVEKAYAKFNGDYEAIANGGYPKVALSDLTGQQATQVPTSTDSLAAVRHALANGQPVVAATLSQPVKGVAGYDLDGKNVQGNDLVYSHAYTITAIDDKAQTVTMRNPWGYGSNDHSYVTISFEEYTKALAYVTIGQLP
jgi:hypothetical protein